MAAVSFVPVTTTGPPNGMSGEASVPAPTVTVRSGAGEPEGVATTGTAEANRAIAGAAGGPEMSMMSSPVPMTTGRHCVAPLGKGPNVSVAVMAPVGGSVTVCDVGRGFTQRSCCAVGNERRGARVFVAAPSEPPGTDTTVLKTTRTSEALRIGRTQISPRTGRPPGKLNDLQLRSSSLVDECSARVAPRTFPRP